MLSPLLLPGQVKLLRCQEALLNGLSATIQAAIGNVQRTVQGTDGPAASIQRAGAPFATILGTSVELYIFFSGLSSGAGDIVSLTPQQDGASLPLLPIASLNTPTGKLFSLDMLVTITGLVPGVTHTYGYLVTDNSAGTISQSANSGLIIVKEIP